MDSVTHPSARWLSRLPPQGPPMYARVVEALEAAIRDGELQAGDQLPPQRTVAGLLGVDLTTVTRAYAAARARGLIDGTVGRGTFVRARASEDETGLVDLSMNLPPPPQGLSLGTLLRETTAAVLERTDPATLMSYHPGGGSLGQRASAAAWLAPMLGALAPERVLVTPGA
ncbi:MAG TPA: GntR family transcriptional regulator, partial [Phenylobacterium sp.]|nr:GntR family transcriptional regulator [Phenylobacterium sp.]